MNRALRVVGIFAFIGVLLIALWTAGTRSARRSSQESLKDTMHSAITNLAAFARNRFTGGIGAALATDPATGALRIVKVLAGSPAEMAGLRDGDHILQVDGVATSGRTLAQNVESIRGFAAGSVKLTVHRAVSSNLQCVIHRSSWMGLGVPR